MFFELHQDLLREGPGDDASTRRALTLVVARCRSRSVLDIGCGPGMQTCVLARETRGRVVALDTHRPFLHQLKAVASGQRLAGQIAIVNASMFAFPFADGRFDLVWAEGAIYLAGFERGLRDWRRLLTPNGCVAVTELSWLRPDHPAEAAAFWQAAYPAMRSVDENLATTAVCGYRDLGHFTLPESSWWDSYYTPLEQRIELLRGRFRDDPDAIHQLDQTADQIDLYRKYSDAYGYVFYVMQRT